MKSQLSMTMDDSIRSPRLHIMGLEEASSQLASVNSIWGFTVYQLLGLARKKECSRSKPVRSRLEQGKLELRMRVLCIQRQRGCIPSSVHRSLRKYQPT